MAIASLFAYFDFLRRFQRRQKKRAPEMKSGSAVKWRRPLDAALIRRSARIMSKKGFELTRQRRHPTSGSMNEQSSVRQLIRSDAPAQLIDSTI